MRKIWGQDRLDIQLDKKIVWGKILLEKDIDATLKKR